MTTFVAIVIVAVSMLIVGWPLFRRPAGGPRLVEDTEVSELLAQKDSTLLAISELEADHEMGALSKGDYEELRQKYEERAVALMKTTDQLQSERGLGVSQDFDHEIEARVSNLRRGRKKAAPADRCNACGAQTLPEDVFCSKCGASLRLTCPGCAASVAAEDSFCARCGAAMKEA